MKKNVRVAVCQINVTNSIQKNRDKILDFIDKAARKRADIACFPECSTIHDEKLIIKNKYTIANEIKNTIESISKKCAEKKIWCIFGTYITEKNKIYNTVHVIDRNGRIKHVYKKVHLWRREKKLVASGKTNKAINTDFGRIGIITCWDFAFPAFIQKLSKAGARIIFCPTFLVCSVGTEKLMESIPIVRSFENISYYIMCDALHKQTASRSFIAGPYSIMKRIEKKEGLIVADLDMKKIDFMRKRFDTLKYD